jgi:hypothetical protein
MPHSTLIVGRIADAERIGAISNLDAGQYPHFYCGNLDAGILGQIFWDASNSEQQSRQVEAIEALYSRSGAPASVFVHALPRHVCERYAQMSEAELDDCATRWFKPNGHIRMPRSQAFDRTVIRELARLARLAVETDRAVLIRTQYLGPHREQQYPS